MNLEEYKIAKQYAEAIEAHTDAFWHEWHELNYKYYGRGRNLHIGSNEDEISLSEDDQTVEIYVWCCGGASYQDFPAEAFFDATWETLRAWFNANHPPKHEGLLT